MKSKKKPIQRSKRDSLILFLLAVFHYVLGAVLILFEFLLYFFTVMGLWSISMTMFFEPLSFIATDASDVAKALFAVYFLGILFFIASLYFFFKFLSSDLWEFKAIANAYKRVDNALKGNTHLARRLGGLD